MTLISKREYSRKCVPVPVSESVTVNCLILFVPALPGNNTAITLERNYPRNGQDSGRVDASAGAI